MEEWLLIHFRTCKSGIGGRNRPTTQLVSENGLPAWRRADLHVGERPNGWERDVNVGEGPAYRTTFARLTSARWSLTDCAAMA